jgi:hypothetical protein
MGADDIRRQLHNEEVMRNLNSSREELERFQQHLQTPASPPTPASKPADEQA